MSKRFLLISSPSFFGVVLLAVSQLDLYLFHSGVFDARTIVTWELPIALIGLLSGLAVFLWGIVFLIQKQWRYALISISSALVFLVLFSVGGALGGAYLNVT